MSDDEVPPPYSEQELDRKISQALVISVQQPQATQHGSSEDGEWERWNEEVFTAAAASNGLSANSDVAGSSESYRCAPSHERHEYHSNSPLPVPSAVAPLRIHKRGENTNSISASWAGDLDCDGSFGSPRSSSSGHALWNTLRGHHENPLDSEDEDHSLPPPPFASVGPRIDGIVRLEYHPESTPPSPLNSPVPDRRLPLPPDPPFPSLRQMQTSGGPHPNSVEFSVQSLTPQRSPRQSLPVPPRSPNYHLEQRPVSNFYPRQSLASHQITQTQPTATLPLHTLRQATVSTLPPSQLQAPSHTISLSALNKADQAFPPTSQPQSYAISALYNSSVSAYLPSQMSMQPRESYSSRQNRRPQSAQPETPQNIRMGDHATLRTPPTLGHGAASISYNVNQSTPIQARDPQNSTNASHFPQYPSYPTHHHRSGSTAPRWATTEQQYNQNFRY